MIPGIDFVLDPERLIFLLTIMIHVLITNLFHAYDLQINPYNEDKISSQDVINYREAQFQVALQAMMKRSEKDQK